MAWKNTRQVFQTDGEPPSSGSTMRAIIGSTRNIRNALKNKVPANRTTSTPERRSERAATAGATLSM